MKTINENHFFFNQILFLIISTFIFMIPSVQAQEPVDDTEQIENITPVTGPLEFVGTETCADCHDSEYESFKTYSKKAKSGEAVLRMKSDLTPDELQECFYCHVTGYGKPGGFLSFDETPEKSDAGCEVCHGPGSRHVESEGELSPELAHPTIEDCETCHNPERVNEFDYKPLIFGGAH